MWSGTTLENAAPSSEASHFPAPPEKADNLLGTRGGAWSCAPKLPAHPIDFPAQMPQNRSGKAARGEHNRLAGIHKGASFANFDFWFSNFDFQIPVAPAFPLLSQSI
jgi:hypothetical protein